MPVQRASGTVVAVIVRDDDAEDKLVVETEGRAVPAEEIRAKTLFQEKYCQARLILLDSGSSS